MSHFSPKCRRERRKRGVVRAAFPFGKHTTRRGKTPVLSADKARQLLDSIDTSHVVGLRDRALIGLMTYAFARAAAAMDLKDYYVQGRRWWVRLHEKGGKRHEMPAHHISAINHRSLAVSCSERLGGLLTYYSRAARYFDQTGVVAELRRNQLKGINGRSSRIARE
jgi:hypothetical protein